MSISWPLERRKDELAGAGMGKVQRYRLWYSEWGVLILVSIGVALAAGCVSVTTTWLATLREGFCRSPWYLAGRVCSSEAWTFWPRGVGWLVYPVLSLAYAAVAALLVHYAPRSVMSGIGDLKSYFQGFAAPQSLDTKTLAVKLLGIGLVSASGLWLGQEAPLVHVAAIATSLLSGALPISEARRRDLVLASTAAGISVAFSSPLGGVLFGMETFLPTKSVLWKMFVCSMVANLLLRTLVAPASASGGIVVPETGLFHISYDRPWHTVELLPFCVLGVLGGLYGAAFSRFVNSPACLYAARPFTAVLALTAATALLSYPTIISRVPHTELLAHLFAECREDDMSFFCRDSSRVPGLLYTFVMGAVLTPVSVTLPIPSGFLFPTILVGALMGRLMGLAMRAILDNLHGILSTSLCPDASQHCITPGVYALVGAGAVLTGVTRLTVSSVVLMFEITGGLSFIVPIMTGVIVSKWVSDNFSGTRAVYGIWDAETDAPILPDSSATVPDLAASEFMTPRASVVAIAQSSLPSGAPSSPSQAPPSPSSAAAEARCLPSSPYRGVPILGPNDEFIDFVIAKTGQSEPTVVLAPNASLVLVESSIRQIGMRVVIICVKGVFQGLITRSDVVSALKSSTDLAAVDGSDGAEEFEIDETAMN